MRRSRPLRRLLAFTLIVSSLAVYVILRQVHFNGRVFTCLNQNHHDVESRLTYFNKELIRSLIGGDTGGQMTYEDDDNWRPIFPGVYVYSAYLERRAVGSSWTIRIVSVTKNDGSELQRTRPSIQCWISSDKQTYVVEAKNEPVPEHSWLPMGTSSFLCPVEFPEAVLNHSTVRVALGQGHKMEVPNWVDVHMPQKSKAKCCAVCTNPITGHFDKLSALAEFVGYHSMVGVRRFDFYVGQVPREVELFFVHLQRVSGAVIRVHRWNLRFNESQLLEHQASQLDCAYRARSESEYVINVDFDEFLVPKYGRTILEALLPLEASHGEDLIGSIVVPKQFFCSEFAYDKDHMEKRREVPLMTRARKLREMTSWKLSVPRKYMTKANATEYAGVGFALGHVGGRRIVDVAENALALHHYTSCCGLTKPLLYGLVSVKVLSNSMVVEDISLSRFSDAIANSAAVVLVKSFFAPTVTETIEDYEPLKPLDGEFHFWYIE